MVESYPDSFRSVLSKRQKPAQQSLLPLDRRAGFGFGGADSNSGAHNGTRSNLPGATGERPSFFPLALFSHPSNTRKRSFGVFSSSDGDSEQVESRRPARTQVHSYSGTIEQQSIAFRTIAGLERGVGAVITSTNAAVHNIRSFFSYAVEKSVGLLRSSIESIQLAIRRPAVAIVHGTGNKKRIVEIGSSDGRKQAKDRHRTADSRHERKRRSRRNRSSNSFASPAAAASARELQLTLGDLDQYKPTTSKKARPQVFPPPVALWPTAPHSGSLFGKRASLPSTALKVGSHTSSPARSPSPENGRGEQRQSTLPMTPPLTPHGQRVGPKDKLELASSVTALATKEMSVSRERKGSSGSSAESFGFSRLSLRADPMVKGAMRRHQKDKQERESQYPFYISIKEVHKRREELFLPGGAPRREKASVLEDILYRNWIAKETSNNEAMRKRILVAVLKIGRVHPDGEIKGPIDDHPNLKEGLREGIRRIVFMAVYKKLGTYSDFFQKADEEHENLLQERKQRDQRRSRFGQSSTVLQLVASARRRVDLADEEEWGGWKGRKLEANAFAQEPITVDLCVSDSEPEPEEEVPASPTGEVPFPAPPTGEDVFLLDSSSDEEDSDDEEDTLAGQKFFSSQGTFIKDVPGPWKKKIDDMLALPNRRTHLPCGLTPYDLARLFDHSESRANWLNDEVVNMFFDCIQAATQKPGSGLPVVRTLSSFWYGTVAGAGGNVGVASRWYTRAKIERDSFMDIDYIFIPINTGSHWTLLVILPAERSVEYYDSLGGGGNRCLQLGMELVRFVMDGADGFDMEEWSVCAGESGMQSNGDDCGVFTIWNGLAITLGIVPSAVVKAEVMMWARKLTAAILLNEGFTGYFDLSPMLEG